MLSFHERRGFISEILRRIDIMGEKFKLRQKRFRIFRRSVYLHAVLAVNFPEQFGTLHLLEIFERLQSFKI